jgi:endonuclease/exonuclease/phosphatase family metal-dependent hydrolase
MYTNFRRSWLVGLIFTALLAASGSPPAMATWVDRNGGYTLYIRNNSLNYWYLDYIGRYTVESDCDINEHYYHYGTGSTNDIVISPGAMVPILTINGSDCREDSDIWNFQLYRWTGTTKTTFNTVYFANGKFKMADPGYHSSFQSTSFTYGSSYPVVYMGQDQLYSQGAYVTIGNNYFGSLGPTRTSSTDNTLTVTTSNAHMADPDGSRDDQCERGKWFQALLKSLNTDVLLLQEMNYHSQYCSTDAHDLISYLWTGTANETFANDSYAKGDNGQGVSPQMGGMFPYVSQMVEGVSADYDEDKTGGSIILSKYPVSMIYNERWTGGADVGEGQKGFIIIKVTKNSKDYYILNTHLSCCDAAARREQFSQIAEKLNTLPTDVRVIVGGDLNSGLNPAAEDPSWLNENFSSYAPEDKFGGATGSWIMSQQIYTAYYQYSRDAGINFFGNLSERKNIDWAVPVQKKLDGSGNFTMPTSYRWWVHPMRYPAYKYGEMSDHFAVSAVFGY